MRRWFTTFAAVLFCSAALRADVTVVQTTTIEGGMASMAAAANGPVTPKQTTRIKGMKMRTDIEAGPVIVATIIDLATRQVIILRPDLKTATISTPQVSAPTAGAPQTSGPTLDGSVTPTGKSQTIDGVKCDEFTFTTTMDMSSVAGAQMPPEAVAMLQGMKMNMAGSMWLAKDAPGAVEYVAAQKALTSSDLAGAVTSASGMKVPGMDKLMKAMSNASGMPYLTEMTMNIDGTGQMADMMRQMGPMKITMKVSSVDTTPISDDFFKIPEGYTVTKQ